MGYESFVCSIFAFLFAAVNIGFLDISEIFCIIVFLVAKIEEILGNLFRIRLFVQIVFCDIYVFIKFGLFDKPRIRCLVSVLDIIEIFKDSGLFETASCRIFSPKSLFKNILISIMCIIDMFETLMIFSETFFLNMVRY